MITNKIRFITGLNLYDEDYYFDINIVDDELRFRDIDNNIEGSYKSICHIDKIDELIKILQDQKTNYETDSQR